MSGERRRVKMRSYRRILAALTILMSVGVAAAAAPEWVTRVPNHPELLQGVGAVNSSGDPESDRARADNAAIAEIARQIHVQITSTMSSFYSEEMDDSGYINSSEGVERISSQYTEQTLEGITIRDRYYDKKNNIYYTYATISRLEVDKQFLEKANRAVAVASDYHRFAQRALRDGAVFTAVGHYIRALEELFPAQACLKEKVFGDIDGNERNEAVQARLENELASILGGISLTPVSGTGMKADRINGLAQPLMGKATYKLASGARIPLASTPLKTEWVNAEGRLGPENATDAMGNFGIRVLSIDSASDKIVLLRTTLDMGDLAVFREQLPNLFAQLQRTACTFEFHVDVASSIRVFVDIRELEGNKPSRSAFSTSLLTGKLVNQQYRVIDQAGLSPEVQGAVQVALSEMDDARLASAIRGDADYAIIGDVFSAISDSMNTGYPMVFARAGAEVRIVDLSTGRVVANSTISEIKGVGNNGRKAHRQAIEKCAGQMVAEIESGLKSAMK